LNKLATLTGIILIETLNSNEKGRHCGADVYVKGKNDLRTRTIAIKDIFNETKYGD